MTKDEILAKVAKGEILIEEASKLLEEVEFLQRTRLYCKVSPKRAVSLYGLQRMPTTLYVDQWERLLAFADEIRKFINENKPKLKRKEHA